MNIFDEMISARLRDSLAEELADLESENNGCCSFFAPASRNLNPKDFKRLVAAAKRKLKRLEKAANGCPANPKQWFSHYGGE